MQNKFVWLLGETTLAVSCVQLGEHFVPKHDALLAMVQALKLLSRQF